MDVEENYSHWFVIIMICQGNAPMEKKGDIIKGSYWGACKAPMKKIVD